MRGRISDQDLTDYALNELEAHDRMYVESMLAVSEECRADIYDMIEMGQMLEEGFDGNIAPIEELSLTSSQRAQVLVVRRDPFATARKAAGVLAAAACVAFALTHPTLWPDRGTAVHVARVSREVASVVTHAVAPMQTASMAASFDSLRALVEEPAKWMPEAASAVGTPPQWLDIDADPVMTSVGMPDLGMPDLGTATF